MKLSDKPTKIVHSFREHYSRTEIVFKEIIAAYSEKHTLSRQNAELLIIKTGGT
jgi:hypothetical protein